MMAAAPAMPDASAPTTGTLAAQDPPETAKQQTADAAYPRRSRSPAPSRSRATGRALWRCCRGGVPMPRPRPEAAGSTASEGSATPLGWLQKLFTPQQQ